MEQPAAPLQAFVGNRSMQRMFVFALIASGALASFSPSNVTLAAESSGPSSEAAAPATAGGPIAEVVHLQDSTGEVHILTPASTRAARAIVFLSGECPISKSYMPVLKRLQSDWQANEGVKLLGVWSDPLTPPADIASFVKEYELNFPVLIDREQVLAAKLQPTHVPEAFVLDRDGKLAYRGRIDDTYAKVGQRRPAATKNDLAGAVSALFTGGEIAEPKTTPVGCHFETLPENEDEDAEITFTRDVAPIVFTNCVACHREGEVGPFSLTDYTSVAKRGKQIMEVIDERLMPPWMPSQTHGEFEGQRSLTDKEKETIRKWLAAGSPEGDSTELPPLPPATNGWRLGEPDMIVEMPVEFELRADGADVFQCFVIPVDIPEDKFVAAIDFVPGNSKIVHHSILFLDNNGVARKRDAATPEVGYSTFGGPGFAPTGSLGGWSPGKTPRKLAGGMGRYFQKGSDILMQIHYHPSGKVEKDRSKAAIYFIDKPKNVAADIWVADHSHNIPAGESDYKVKASYKLNQELQMLGVVPHMHLLGRSMTAVAKLPDGTSRELVNVPNWDFDWQDDYRFTTPFRLPKDTVIEVEAIYDNSENNPSNPSSPPQRVTWGEETTNEMLYCFFLVAVDNPKQNLAPLLQDMLRREAISRATGRGLFKFGK